jgi:hypothetical protein
MDGHTAAAQRSGELAVTSTLTLSPQPDDLALAAITFSGAGRRASVSPRTLRIAVSGPMGDDYMAVAKVLLVGVRKPQALVVLVNRPSALLDPTSVHVQMKFDVLIGSKDSAESFLGWPERVIANDPLKRPAVTPPPKLCRLPLKGVSLTAAELSLIASRGSPLTGIDAARAVAQAYDLVCGLPYSSAFAQAVAGQPVSVSPIPPESPPAPSPVPSPPVGKVPGEGCVPAPGYACPA